MFYVGRDLPAESDGILLIKVDLVFGAAEPEPQRLIRWASIKVVFEFDTDPLRHRGLHDCDGLKDNPGAVRGMCRRLPRKPSGAGRCHPLTPDRVLSRQRTTNRRSKGPTAVLAIRPLTCTSW